MIEISKKEMEKIKKDSSYKKLNSHLRYQKILPDFAYDRLIQYGSTVIHYNYIRDNSKRSILESINKFSKDGLSLCNARIEIKENKISASSKSKTTNNDLYTVLLFADCVRKSS